MIFYPTIWQALAAELLTRRQHCRMCRLGVDMDFEDDDVLEDEANWANAEDEEPQVAPLEQGAQLHTLPWLTPTLDAAHRAVSQLLCTLFIHLPALPSRGCAGQETMEVLEGAPEATNRPRITTRYLTKYERARVLGTRALQLSMNAPPMVDVQGESGGCFSMGGSPKIRGSRRFLGHAALCFALKTALLLCLARPAVAATMC